MTRKEKVEALYQHMKDVMSAGSARALADYTMKIVESWPKETEPDAPPTPPGPPERKPRKVITTVGVENGNLVVKKN